ncbi:MFS transporter [Terricaulis silvestris]|nr:MFS transporter [Terricaulis silvestris]
MLEDRVIRAITWRVLPLVCLIVFFSALDRSNIAYGAVTMLHDLSMTNTGLGWASGAFALGYVLFGVPSTLMFQRIGARRWLSLIMIVWGALSAATAFVSTPHELAVVRFLLGAAEAGANPGLVIYIGRWFPENVRGRAFSIMFFAMGLTTILGGPFASVLMSLDGVGGFAGWQWLFVVEGLPTIMLALIVLFALPDTLEDTKWMAAPEKDWLSAQVKSGEERQSDGLWSAFSNARIWPLLLINVLAGSAIAGTTAFTPLVIGSMGFAPTQIGWVNTAPALLSVCFLPLWGYLTDKHHDRAQVAAGACVVMCIGLIGVSLLLPSPWALVPLAVLMIGMLGYYSPFWTLPTTFLRGYGAAAGVSLINLVGTLGAFFGPIVIGALADRTQSYAAGLLACAGMAGAGAILLLMQNERRRLRRLESKAALEGAGRD